MKYLLDTNIYLWVITDQRKKMKQLADPFDDDNNDFFVSPVSLFEIAVKKSIGKLKAPDDFHSIVEESGFEHLPLIADHILQLTNLPLIHHDPFDRLLIAQAKSEKMTLLSADKNVLAYF